MTHTPENKTPEKETVNTESALRKAEIDAAAQAVLNENLEAFLELAK